nr:hypothetical protein CFP56_21154 [Quercus suber]
MDAGRAVGRVVSRTAIYLLTCSWHKAVDFAEMIYLIHGETKAKHELFRASALLCSALCRCEWLTLSRLTILTAIDVHGPVTVHLRLCA